MIFYEDAPGDSLPQTADAARRALHRLGDPDKAKFLQGFFKPGPGQYAHGDVFIGVVGTHYFIRKNDFGDTLRIAERLLENKEDLMHKATGWMLREVGKRDVAVLKKFLDNHRHHMPRTALRYAIERFSDDERRKYLAR